MKKPLVFFVATFMLVACQIDGWLAPVPTATPTKTLTPTMTITPTETLAPTVTPTVDPWDVVSLPQIEFVIATLVNVLRVLILSLAMVWGRVRLFV